MESNEEIKEAKNELDRISQDETLRRMLLKEKLARMDMKQMKKEAIEEGFEEGKREGKREGIKEGIKEGKIEGQKEGEKKEKIETAKRMLEKSMPIETIIEITQLTEKEINEIINNK